MQGPTYRPGEPVPFRPRRSSGRCPGQAMAIGLFEALFGPPRPVYVVRAPRLSARRSFAPRRVRARGWKVVKPRAPAAVDVSNRPVKPRLVNVALTPVEQKSPLAKFLGDQTLRNGDVVVTAKGPYVFKGTGGSRHRLADFSPAETARNLDKNMRAKVAEITRANRWSASLESTIMPLPPGPERGRRFQVAVRLWRAPCRPPSWRRTWPLSGYL
jgi:hypothetical protein